MDKITISQDVISIYGAIVGTIAVIISIVLAIVEISRYRREVRSKIVVTFYLGTRVEAYADGRLGKWQSVLNIRMVNHSQSDKFIKQPGIEINKLSEKFSLIDTNSQVQYPKKLAPGEEFEITYDAARVKEEMNARGATKVRAIMIDTMGKNYYSKWVKIKDIQT